MLAEGNKWIFIFLKNSSFFLDSQWNFYRSEFIKKEIIRVGWPDDSLNNK
jgi:hypothetical protein